MLARNQKISRELFKEVLKRGKNFHSPNLSLQLIISKTERRLAFVVSKKVSQKAVGRNLLKRRGYSIARKLFPELKLNFAGVIFLKPSAGKLSFQEFKTELTKLFFQAKLLP